MPLAVINRVIVDPSWRLVALAAVCAAGKHNVTSRGSTKRTDAGCHIDIVIRRATCAIRGEKDLSCQPLGIDRCVEQDVATEVNAYHSIEGRYDPAVSCVARTQGPHLVRIQIHAADKQIAVSVDIRRAPSRRIWKEDRTHPGRPT